MLKELKMLLGETRERFLLRRATKAFGSIVRRVRDGRDFSSDIDLNLTSHAVNSRVLHLLDRDWGPKYGFSPRSRWQEGPDYVEDVPTQRTVEQRYLDDYWNLCHCKRKRDRAESIDSGEYVDKRIIRDKDRMEHERPKPLKQTTLDSWVYIVVDVPPVVPGCGEDCPCKNATLAGLAMQAELESKLWTYTDPVRPYVIPMARKAERYKGAKPTCNDLWWHEMMLEFDNNPSLSQACTGKVNKDGRTWRWWHPEICAGEVDGENYIIPGAVDLPIIKITTVENDEGGSEDEGDDEDESDDESQGEAKGGNEPGKGKDKGSRIQKGKGRERDIRIPDSGACGGQQRSLDENEPGEAEEQVHTESSSEHPNTDTGTTEELEDQHPSSSHHPHTLAPPHQTNTITITNSDSLQTQKQRKKEKKKEKEKKRKISETPGSSFLRFPGKKSVARKPDIRQYLVMDETTRIKYEKKIKESPLWILDEEGLPVDLELGPPEPPPVGEGEEHGARVDPEDGDADEGDGEVKEGNGEGEGGGDGREIESVVDEGDSRAVGTREDTGSAGGMDVENENEHEHENAIHDQDANAT